jgi:hypothetical protein
MAVTPGSAEPRFPGYDVTGQSETWDEVTTAVVLRRLRPSGGAVFFTGKEEPVARALVDRLLAQDDDPKVPVFEIIDQRLAERRGDGFRYAALPDDPETWRQSVAGLESDAMEQYQQPFAELAIGAQVQIVEEVRISKGTWRGLPAQRVFSIWMRYACTAYYSHPWAWNEIGFGGPAYPRGYKNLGLDRREPWERRERDAHNPIPWVERSEGAKRRHAQHLSSAPSSPPAKTLQ